MPPLLMVDDILTISKCSPTALAMNSTLNAFIESKNLRLSHKKCVAIHVGKSKGSCPELKIHEEKMHRGNSSPALALAVDTCAVCLFVYTRKI